jgi:phenylalanyl-tRNA synthetase alpha chain
MKETLQKLEKDFQKMLLELKTEEDIQKISLHFLGRKSELNDLAKNISSLDKEHRGEFGKMVNTLKREIENALELKQAEFNQAKKDTYSLSEKEDMTQIPVSSFSGRRHPVSAFCDHIVHVMTRLGFSEASGPELETEWYNFTALCLPPDHPARDMQATFFIEGLKAKKSGAKAEEDERDLGYVLRTQTSSVQVRYMQKNTPPFRIFSVGKTYRNDSDATHSPMFHQVEGLFVDTSVSLANLKSMLLDVCKYILEDDDLDIRFRLSYFPFVEPCLEVDVLFTLQDGKQRWLEIGGAGMVHPDVLKNSGVNPEEYMGFAFGLGIERLVMIKHNIKDMRLLFENDLQFLDQF